MAQIALAVKTNYCSLHKFPISPLDDVTSQSQQTISFSPAIALLRRLAEKRQHIEI